MDLRAALHTRLHAAGILPHTPVLLAVSGGMDSMTLWHLLRATGQAHAVAHSNFSLRGDESDADTRLVIQQAQEWGITSHIRRFDTAAYAASEGLSIQMAARRLRYGWFGELMDAHPYTHLLTAHHADDRTETLLWNLLRSRSFEVLEDLPARHRRILRPLLGISRARLAEYARQEGVTYREDSSNALDAYPRNFLRHKVIPLLETLNPDLNGQFACKAAQYRQQQSVLVRHVLSPLLARLSNEQRFALAGWPDEEVQALGLEYWLWTRGVPQPLRAQAQTLLAARKGTCLHWEAQTCKLVREADELRWAPIMDTLPGSFSISTLPYSGRVQECYLELSRIQAPDRDTVRSTSHARQQYWDLAQTPLPWTLRPWQAGDSVRLLGAPGKRKVSDWLTDAQVPHSERARTWLLCDARGRIFYVYGLRIAHYCRLQAETAEAVSLSSRPAIP
ncbi:MAG: tRNA lysidine(34) synthetase TilS [Bacteroidetes bacterium]|nr:tRNA lysidine(34) synthetase TilS [Bacteroidota bacterium]